MLHARTHTDGDFASHRASTTAPPGGGLSTGAAATSDPPPPVHAAADYHTLVLHGPMEHHSNILAWREASQTLVLEVEPDGAGRVDQKALETLLRQHASIPRKIGTFCAASNVTGVREDVDAITAQLHQHGALAFWDYAAAGPHTKIDMNPSREGVDRNALAKDAVFVSPHKYAGGPGSPGLLIVKKELLSNAVPVMPGGGTVFYVTGQWHRYIENPEEREEGGTPNILGIVRCGLVFQLQAAVGHAALEAREAKITRRVLQRLAPSDTIHVLGDTALPKEDAPGSGARLPIFAVMIKPAGSSRFLHWNFVAMLLNDLFGIQSRGGCLCAGPYGHRLLNIPPEAALALEEELLHKKELLRPGFVRISMSYEWTDGDVDYALRALEWVAAHGQRMLADYTFYADTGEYRHRTLRKQSPFRQWLHEISYASGKMEYPSFPASEAPDMEATFSAAEDALAALDAQHYGGGRAQVEPEVLLGLQSEALRGLRWFVGPADVEGQREREHVTSEGKGPGNNVALLPAFPMPVSREPANGAPAADVMPAADKGEAPAPACPLILMRGKRELAPSEMAPAAYVGEGEDGNSGDEDGDAVMGDVVPSDIDGVEGSQRSTRSRDGERKGEGEPPLKRATDTLQAQSRRSEGESSAETLNGGVARPYGKKKKKVEGEGKPSKYNPPSAARARQNQLFPKIPSNLIKPIGKAVREFGMIRAGDRVLLGLSGGKDSLSLLHALVRLQRTLPYRFELGAVTMDPQFPGFDPSPLIGYMKTLGIPYFFESQPLLEAAQKTKPSSICSWCSRMKRALWWQSGRAVSWGDVAGQL
jgi:selenocysteine lyase/cysteine desulfurase